MGSKLDCERIIQPEKPSYKPWSSFNPNLKLHLVQASKVFSKSWLDAVENSSEEDVLRKANLTKKQVFHCLRNNRDLLSGSVTRYMQEASYTMQNSLELLNMVIRFRDKNNLDL